VTTLVIEELKTTLTQEFTILTKPRMNIVQIRPHLYVHNSPSGTFTFSILDSSNNVLISSNFQSQSLYDALDTVNQYAHGYFNMMLNEISLDVGTYKLRLSSSGYTFSEISYLGWVRDHEDLKNPISYTPASDLENPLSFEIWARGKR
jgi:hypothetical protein